MPGRLEYDISRLSACSNLHQIGICSTVWGTLNTAPCLTHPPLGCRSFGTQKGDHARVVYCRTYDIPHANPACCCSPSCNAMDNSCYKWEQGDIPEAHVAFLGLGGASAGRRSSGTDSKTRRSPASERDSKGGNTRSEEGDRFITYWSEVKTDRPVRWKFFDGSTFEVSVLYI